VYNQLAIVSGQTLDPKLNSDSIHVQRTLNHNPFPTPSLPLSYILHLSLPVTHLSLTLSSPTSNLFLPSPVLPFLVLPVTHFQLSIPLLRPPVPSLPTANAFAKLCLVTWNLHILRKSEAQARGWVDVRLELGIMLTVQRVE